MLLHRSSVIVSFLLLLWPFTPISQAFFVALYAPHRAARPTHRLTRAAAGQGFGGNDNDNNSGQRRRPAPEKTYEEASAPIRDMIDSEAAMQDFFSSREEWLPLFRSMADASCQARSFLGGGDDDDVDDDDDAANNVEEIDFHETSEPWRRLDAIPQAEDDRQVVAGFLDSMHQSLLDIPVTESKEDDENDVQFLEEGRRLLAISRFHVLQKNQGGTVESYDEVFRTCWSELHELSSKAEEHTGSLILLPEYDLQDLRRFTDMNLLRPLEWLGVHGDFEITSMQRESPAIRLLYKLNDMPESSEIYGDEEEEE